MYNKRFHTCTGVSNTDFLLFNPLWEFHTLLASIGFSHLSLLLESIIFTVVFKNWKIACKDSDKAFKIYVIEVNQFKKFKINRKQKKVILDRTLNIKSNGMKIHVWYSYMMWSSWQIVYAKEGRISPHQKEYLLLSMHTYTGRRTRPAQQRCWCHGFMRCPRKWIHFIHM